MADTPGDERTLRADDSEEHHVDVHQAEELFNELSRALSKRSNEDYAKSHAENGSTPGLQEKDVEKASTEDELRFDLREYLQSSNDANQAAGIKHKHVGVTWENLQVEVVGNEDQKVSGRERFLFMGCL